MQLDEGKVTSELMVKLIKHTKEDKEYILKEESFTNNIVQDIA